MPPDKLLTVVAPSNPHFKVATEKGWTYLTWMAVFSEGRWGQPERNNFEVGGHGGSHAWIYNSIGWLFFMKNPDWNEGHCQSLPALLFGTFRTLADIRTEDAKYHGSNLNYKLDKRSLAGICGRRSTLACMLLFCMAGARLWKHGACVAWQISCHENLQEKCSCCVLCWLCVATWQGHATQASCVQSLAPATQKSSMHAKVLRLPQIPARLLLSNL